MCVCVCEKETVWFHHTYHQVNILGYTAIVKLHAGSLESADVGFHLNRSGQDAVGKIIIEGWMLTKQPVRFCSVNVWIHEENSVRTWLGRWSWDYLCFGCRLYSLWLNRWLRALSPRLQKTLNGRSNLAKLKTLLKDRSRGQPLSPTRFRIQAPLRVLR